METNQTSSTASAAASAKRFFFWPGSITFIAAVLIFLLPFAEIQCGNTTLKEVRGFEFATGFTVKSQKTNASVFGATDNDYNNEKNNAEKNDPNLFALIALGLGILGAIITIFKKGRSILAAAFGAIAALALIGLMIDVKNDSKLDQPKSSNDLFGASTGFGDNMVRVEFTFWFYAAIILFLAAAYFCWKKKINNPEIKAVTDHKETPA